VHTLVGDLKSRITGGFAAHGGERTSFREGWGSIRIQEEKAPLLSQEVKVRSRRDNREWGQGTGRNCRWGGRRGTPVPGVEKEKEESKGEKEKQTGRGGKRRESREIIITHRTGSRGREP